MKSTKVKKVAKARTSLEGHTRKGSKEKKKEKERRPNKKRDQRETVAS